MTQLPKKLLDPVQDAIQLKHSVGLARLPGGPWAQGAAEAEAELVPARQSYLRPAGPPRSPPAQN